MPGAYEGPVLIAAVCQGGAFIPPLLCPVSGRLYFFRFTANPSRCFERVEKYSALKV